MRRKRNAFGATLIACVGIAALIALVALPALGGKKAGTAGHRGEDGPGGTTTETTTTTSTQTTPPGPPFAVGVRMMPFVDRSRTVTYRNGETGPRVLTTEVRYPALGRAGAGAIPNAAPQTESGPFPLIVFGHGFEQLPSAYAHLLNAWARAGYVVAAPIFPAENANAPGGPDEEDLVNQPGDMKFVITEMQAAGQATEGPFSGLIATEEVAVAGHSDGADTALAAAYDEYEGMRDPAVRAAVILSGAEIPFLPRKFVFPAGGPPLLATQGTADKINWPWETAEYFDAAHPPKYLLELIGAEHMPPYTTQEPQLRIVERVSIDFLNHYLKQRSGSLAAMSAAGNVRGIATLHSDR